MSEATLGDILGRAKRGPDFEHDNTQMIETVPLTPRVDAMLDTFRRQWSKTADECVARAAELEAAAYDLRERAQRLTEAIDLTAEVKGAVIFEIEARERAASLALVKVNTE